MTGPKYSMIFTFEKQDDLVLKEYNRKDGSVFLCFYVSTSIEQNQKNSKNDETKNIHVYIHLFSILMLWTALALTESTETWLDLEHKHYVKRINRALFWKHQVSEHKSFSK